MTEIRDNSSAADRARAREYLFGRLESPELDETEDRLFHEPAFGDLLNEVENDLVDDFVRGALAENERADFIKFFAVNERRREKIQFAAGLHGIANAKRSRAAVPVSWFASLAELFRRKPRLAFAFVIGVTMLAIAPALYNLPHSSDTGEVAETKPPEITLPVHETFPVTNPEPLPTALKSPDVAAKTEPSRVSPAQRPQPPPVTPAVPAKTTLAVLLKPLTRDANGANTIRLTPSAQTVTLSAAISEGDDFAQYELSTTSVSGEPVARRVLKPTNGRLATIVIPTEKLRAGAYEIALRGIDKDGKPEDLNFYRLEVK